MCSFNIDKDKHEMLYRYTKNINDLVKKFDIRIGGREKEIYKVVRILCRLEKNTPVLVGEPGVGKTAIVYGIADMINKNLLNILGDDIHIRSLNIPSLFSGTSYRGELEKRIQGLIYECSQLKKNIILFIDEFHMLFNSNMNMDVSSTFKIAITDPSFNIRFIAATTKSEYSKYIDKDKAIDRRLNIVYVDELNLYDTVETINFVKGRYEKHYGFSIDKDVIRYASKMSKKHVGGNYPDVAFDIIDRTFSNISFKQEIKPEEIIYCEKQAIAIKSNINDKKQLIRKRMQNSNENTEEVINNDKSIIDLNKQFDFLVGKSKQLNSIWNSEQKLFNKIKKLKIERDALINERDRRNRIYDFEGASKITYVDLERVNSELLKLESIQSRFIKTKVDKEEINKSISEKTGIPISRFSIESGNTKLLRDFLLENIIGQDYQINYICDILSAALSNFNISSGPLSTMMFVGTTGVGKTELSILITKYILGNDREPFIIDLSQYSEEYTISSLFGAPAGYIGHDQDGLLSKAVKYNRNNIILFDEIEKAHPKVLLSLMQIMDTGFLVDRMGNTLDFTKTFLIFNSNIISDDQICYLDKNYDANIRHTMKMKFMKPEFINRISDIVLFNKLTNDDMYKIVVVIIKKYVDKISAEHDIYIECSNCVYSYLSKISYNDLYGARDISRNIKKYFVIPIVRTISLTKNNTRPMFVKIKFSVSENKLTIVCSN